MKNKQLASLKIPNSSPSKLENRLWDEILKVIALKMPSQLLPLLNEIFHQTYPLSAPIEFLSTEYVTQKRHQSRQRYPSIFSDIVIKVNYTDIYHLECQMQNDQIMVLRMIEYDFSVALQHNVHAETTREQFTLQFPKSCVLYPASNGQLPNDLSCKIILPNNSVHLYKIPAIKIQSYDLTEIAQKHLTIMLPFVLLRFRPRLKSISNPIKKEELTNYVEQIIVILNNELSENRLTEKQYKQYLELIHMSAQQIFNHNQDLAQEVTNMTKPLLELSEDKIERLTMQLKQKDNQLQKQKDILLQKDLIIEHLTAQLSMYLQNPIDTEAKELIIP